MSLNDRTAAVLVLLLFAAIMALTLYPDPIWADISALTMTDQDGEQDAQQEYRPPMADREPAHKHQRLFFLIDGDRKNLSGAYLEIEPWGHFHQDDGIFHQEVRPLQLDEALRSVDITVEDGCLTFGPDNEAYCSDGRNEIGIVVNGEYHTPDEILDRELQQGDTIVVFYGNPDDPVIDEYAERKLPDSYRPDYRGV